MKRNPQHISPDWCGLQPLTGYPWLAPHSSESMSHEEIALRLGVTRQTIREAEQIALHKCRKWCARNGYRITDLLDFSKLRNRDVPDL